MNTKKFALGSVLAFALSISHSYAQERGPIENILYSLTNFGAYLEEAKPGTSLGETADDELWPQKIENPGLGALSLLPNLAGPVLDKGLNGILLHLFLYAEIPQAPWEFSNYVEMPQIPATNRQVVGITEHRGFTDPHMPPLRWSADGRLGVNSQVGGFPNNPFSVQLYLVQPEAQKTTFIDSAPGPQTLVLDVTHLPFRSLSPEKGALIQHTNICDPFKVDGGRKMNPYSCGVNGEDDCYDVTLISGLTDNGVDVPAGGTFNAQLAEWDRVMGTPLHIRVSKPKTTQAQIVEVQYGEPKYAPSRSGVLFETITPADGRLLVARRAYMPLLWQNETTNKAQIGSYDFVYSVSPPDSEPCDVSEWGQFYPITHAPYDDRVNSRYLFAQQPFRDPTGEIIPDGVDIKGTYPWMDKEAKLFSFQTSPATLFPTYQFNGDTKSRYPVRCVSKENCSVENMSDTDISQDNMFAILGAWTQGKMVLLDDLLNDVDFRIGIRDENQSYLSLYQPHTGSDNRDITGEQSGEVRIGATRIVTTEPIDVPVFDELDNLKGYFRPRNTSMFDSIENRFAYLRPFKHSKPDDVVWLMSSGHSTVELAFDDYLKPDSFIVSNMVGLMKWRNRHWYKMTYYDGWNPLLQKFKGQVRVQNSATATHDRWRIPEYGRVRNGRLEPVANGGIRGKGMWFNGNNTRIEYKISEQPQDIKNSSWFYSLFLDPRDSDSEDEATLIRFPNGSELTLTGYSKITLYDVYRQQVSSFSLPAFVQDHQWFQLSLLVKPNSSGDETGIQFYINGYPYSQWRGAVSDEFFLPGEGVLYLGNGRSSKTVGFKGWMDEFKVFAYEPDIESICNFAHGSLVAIVEDAPETSRWQELANYYSAEQHDKVSDELALYGQEVFDRYVCYHDYSDDNKAHMNNIPDGLVSLKAALQFPEGPLYHDAPRPDSSTNDFCLSCHHPKGIGGLDLEALGYQNVVAKLDPRRQPSQPPAKVYGYIPKNWLPGSPSSALVTGSSGQLIDEWIQPSSESIKPKLLNFAVSNANGIAKFRLEEAAELSSQLMYDHQQSIRVITNGLARRVNIAVNGTKIELDKAPFLLDIDYLSLGENTISATASLADGTESEILSIDFNLLE